MIERFPRSILVLAALVLALAWPSESEAQSAIIGTVRDVSGAVLPGTTVVATSEALIEKARVVHTDGEGIFRIVDLRPGTYTVAFTLDGFAALRRQGIDLPSEFTATLDVELTVGSIEEAVTVTGETGVVDVTAAVRTHVLDREAIDTLPSGRTIQSLGQLVVGVNLNLPDTGGSRGMQQTYMTTRGMVPANNTVLVDGMLVNGLQTDGEVQSYFNDSMNQEITYQTSGIGADTSAGGVRLNMIPREGGNRFSGSFGADYRPGGWQADNLSARHQARGLTTGNSTDRIVDVTAAQGGPVVNDRLWFFLSGRYFSVNNFVPNTFFDDGSLGVDDQFIRSAQARVTWQITRRNKLSAYFDEIDKYRGHDMQSNYDPETSAIRWLSPAYHTAAAKWTSPFRNRMLFEAGWSSNLEYYTNSFQSGVEQPRGSAGWFTNTAQIELDLGGHRKTASTSQSSQSPARYAASAALSYVTGSHNIKAGVQRTWGAFVHTVDTNGDLYRQYRSNSTGVPFSVPNTVVVRNTPIRSAEALNGDVGIFAQDSWVFRRMSLTAGIRWEHLNAQVLEGSSPAGRFVPARNFPARTDLPNWTDWAPRFAVVYDVFGDARTAVKYSINRYNQARTTGVAESYNPLSSATMAIAWRDINANDQPDFTPGCNFGTAGLPGCEVKLNDIPANFGTQSLNTFGDYPRAWNLEHAWELQHELLPRLSTTVSWIQSSFHDLALTSVDQNLSYADYTPIELFSPVTGQPFTAYQRTLASLGRAVNNVDRLDPDRRQMYRSLNFQFNWRAGGGGQFFGGMSIERELQVNCTNPDDPNEQLFCDDRRNAIPWKRGLKLAGLYPVGAGVILSAVLQSNPGPNATTLAGVGTATRNMVISTTSRYPTNCPAPCPAGALVAPGLTTSTLTVPVVPFRASMVERITQLDLKVQRAFRVGRTTVLPALEVFNVNNSDAILTYASVNALAAAYEAPSSIMQGRLIGVGAQVRW
jgi:hypothetical protein